MERSARGFLISLNTLAQFAPRPPRLAPVSGQSSGRLAAFTCAECGSVAGGDGRAVRLGDHLLALPCSLRWRDHPAGNFLAAGLGLNLVLRLDGFAWLFGLLVTGVGFLVVLYARYYMSPG